MLNSVPAPAQRWISILLPPAALLITCVVILPRHRKVQDLEKQIKTVQVQIKDYQDKLRVIMSLPKDPRIATLPLTKQEQSDFLRDLSAMCSQSGNRLLTIGSLAPVMPGAN